MPDADGHHPLRAAAGGALRRRRQPAGLLRLRPAAPRRLGPDRGPARRSARTLLAQLLAGQPPQRRDPLQRPRRRQRPRPSSSSVADRGLEGVVSKRADAPLQPRPLEDLGQGQGAAHRRLRRRRLHPLAAERRPRRAGARRVGRRRARLPRQGRHRLRRRHPRRAARPARAADRRRAARRRPEGHRLGPPDPHRPRPLLQPHRRRRRPPRRLPRPARGHADAHRGRRRDKRLISDADLASIWVTNPTAGCSAGPARPSSTSRSTTPHVGDFMLPHILTGRSAWSAARPGCAKDCFFQRHPFTGMPAGHRPLRGREDRRRGPHLHRRRGRRRATSRSPSSASSSSTPGAAAAT